MTNELDLKNKSISNENITDENINLTETINTPNESLYVTVTIGGYKIYIIYHLD